MTTNKPHHKILIVEDDEDFLSILEKKFTMEGFAVVLAKDGQEGVSMAEKEKPELILSDVLIPKMDGIAMAKKIREFNANVPVIFLTNINDVKETIETQKSDDFDYLIKADTPLNDIVQKVKTKLGL